MKFEDHCKESQQTFGSSFEEVHIWLDEFAGTPKIGFRHRKFRHHLEGIEKTREMFGDKAAEAASQHVKSDLKEEGWSEAYRIPRNEEDYIQMGFF